MMSRTCSGVAVGRVELGGEPERLLRRVVHEAVVLGPAVDERTAVDVIEELLQVHEGHPASTVAVTEPARAAMRSAASPSRRPTTTMPGK